MEYIVLAVIAGIIITVIKEYNAIFSYYNDAERAWSDVLAQERQRAKIVEQLAEVLQQHTAYEGKVLEQITKLRQGIAELSDDKIDTKKQNEISNTNKELMKSLSIAVENYPELQASQSFAKQMQEIINQEENVSAALRIFNRNVADFNSLIQGFPGNIINGTFNNKKTIDAFFDTQSASSFDYKPKFDNK